MKVITSIMVLLLQTAPAVAQALNDMQGAAAPAAPAAAVVPLEELLAEARAINPSIQAARRMAEAAAARVPQAGARPDPVLSAGLMNVRISEPRLAGDEMAMATVQLSQMLPAPGVRAARQEAAEQAHRAALSEALELERAVLARVKASYYELHFVEQALQVLAHNRSLLGDLSEIARGRFAVGRAPQLDVLRSQTEITRLDEQLAGLDARRTAVVAELNALLDRPPTRPLTPVYPRATLALAEASLPSGSFTAAALDSGLGGGFPSLAELQADAVAARPLLAAQAHRVEQARSNVRLAERERFPDIEVMLGYGTQRPGDGMDRMSAMVSVPLPLAPARRQRQMVIEAGHELGAAELESRAMSAEVAAEVATRYAELLRAREQIVLLRDGVLPQARATIESAAAAYQAGSIEFMSLLDAQAMLFRNEIELARMLADFGRALAELERAVGRDLTGV